VTGKLVQSAVIAAALEDKIAVIDHQQIWLAFRRKVGCNVSHVRVCVGAGKAGSYRF
jgi:hypothetical protein